MLIYITVLCLKMHGNNKGKKYINIFLFLYSCIFLSVCMKLPLFLLQGKFKHCFLRKKTLFHISFFLSNHLAGEVAEYHFYGFDEFERKSDQSCAGSGGEAETHGGYKGRASGWSVSSSYSILITNTQGQALEAQSQEGNVKVTLLLRSEQTIQITTEQMFRRYGFWALTQSQIITKCDYVNVCVCALQRPSHMAPESYIINDQTD